MHDYDNNYHRHIGKKPIDALSKEIELRDKAPEFKVGDRVRLTKYKNIFTKSYTANCSKEIFV